MATTATKLYKNWPAICKLEEEDHLMMLVLARLDLDNPTARTRQIIAAFPECFCEQPQQGPYPLSYIRRLGREMQDPGGNGADHPYSYKVHRKLEIPCIVLAYDEKQLAEYPDLLELRPSNIRTAVVQGEIVDYEESRMVVLENNDACREITLTPAELIDVSK